MSYLARLRQQSGLRVLAAGAVPAPARHDAASAAAAGDVPAELEITEVVDIPPRPEAPAIASARVAPPDGAPGNIEPRRPHDAFTPVAAPPVQDRPPGPGRGRDITPPPADRPRVLDADEAPPPREDATPLSREATLHHVFEWLTAAPPPQEAAPPTAAITRAADQEPGPGSLPTRRIAATREPAAGPTRPIAPGQAASPAPAPIELVDVEVLEPAPAAPSRRITPPLPPAPARLADGPVEETLSVSIGAINIRVETPPPPPVTASSAPAAPAPARDTRRPASRLARHYLHP